jgi:uncharacterized protein YecT (DUF1311 family)
MMRLAARNLLATILLAACFFGLTTCAHGSHGLTTSRVGETTSSLTLPVLGSSSPTCPKKQISTIDTEDCGLRTVAMLNRKINRLARLIFARLRASDELTHRTDHGFPADYGRQEFIDGERTWLRYRNAFCRSEGNAAEGGTAAGIYIVYCEASVDAQHVRDLKAFDKALGQH